MCIKPGKGETREEGKKWVKTLKSLSVEPAGLLLVMSAVIAHLIFQNLIMETICRVDLGYPEEDCKEIINKVNVTYKAQEREIQKVSAGIMSFTSVIFSTITVLVVLFIGPWSDVNGRRIPLIMSVSGLVTWSGMMLISYRLLGYVNATTLILITFLPSTLTGGVVVFGMSAYSYISDTTTEKNRTLRTGILSAAVRSGTPIGFALGGTLTKLGVGTNTSLFIALGLALTALLIIILRVETIRPGQKEGQEVTRKKEKCWKKYNPIVKLWQALAILFKKRNNRAKFWLLVFTFICYAAPGSGEYSMLYLFVRERLQWNVGDYGFFSMYNWLMSAAGVVLAMFILSKTFKVSDPVIGFIAGISQIGGSTLYAFTKNATMMYLASATDLLNGTIGVVVRSMLSKTVRPDEVGKLFALCGVLESLLPLIMVPTYALTYKSTMTTFAGAFFLLSAIITIPAEIIFLYFICKKQEPEPKTSPDSVDVEDNKETEIALEKSDQEKELTKLMPPSEGKPTEVD